MNFLTLVVLPSSLGNELRRKLQDVLGMAPVPFAYDPTPKVSMVFVCIPL